MLAKLIRKSGVLAPEKRDPRLAKIVGEVEDAGFKLAIAGPAPHCSANGVPEIRSCLRLLSQLCVSRRIDVKSLKFCDSAQQG